MLTKDEELQEAVDSAAAKFLIELAFAIPKGDQKRLDALGAKVTAFRDAVVARERHAHEALRARVEALEQELAQKDKPVLAVGPSAVLAVWDRWRLGLQLGGFTHSDGVRFRQMVDELFEPFAVDFKRIV